MLGILWCKPQCGPACPVVVCSGAVRYGGFMQGRAKVADGSTEPRKRFSAALYVGVVMAGRSMAVPG